MRIKYYLPNEAAVKEHVTLEYKLPGGRDFFFLSDASPKPRTLPSIY